MDGDKKDFFVSYTQYDLKIAEWIAYELEEAGYQVLFQAWDFKGNWIMQMDNAMQNCNRTIAVLSPYYINSPYTKVEWANAYQNDGMGDGDKLVTVRVADFEPKGILGQLVYVDFVNKTEEQRRDLLLKRVKGERLKPSVKPALEAAEESGESNTNLIRQQVRKPDVVKPKVVKHRVVKVKPDFPARVLNARPDTLDFRDKFYQTHLYDVPLSTDLAEYKKWKVPILDQGQEGACTGFGLATVINYLARKRGLIKETRSVSPNMLYQMGKRYDEWPGEQYSGCSARAVMKGWHKHGVCLLDYWPFQINRSDLRLNELRITDALQRPLAAYYRVNHKDLVAMHTAIAEAGILFATAIVHEGWNRLDEKGIIPISKSRIGAHAFAIVAYDSVGFWIQNSWGFSWGKDGFGLITYEDWLMHGSDVWLAQVGIPVNSKNSGLTEAFQSTTIHRSGIYSFPDLRPHVISLADNGRLNSGGDFGISADDLTGIFEEDFERITSNWKTKRLLLFANGGLIPEKSAVERFSEYRSMLLQAEVYPVFFNWHNDGWASIINVLKEALQKRKTEGFSELPYYFMIDRLDDALEPISRMSNGKLIWSKMKEDARLATESTSGGARACFKYIKNLAERHQKLFEIHIVGHSTGGIFHAPLVKMLTNEGELIKGQLADSGGVGLTVNSCTLWAPACTIELFKHTYLPAINKKRIKQFALYTLSDEAERRDEIAGIYHKSLLYLISNALEEQDRIPGFREGAALLGMEKFLKRDPELSSLFGNAKVAHVIAPNSATEPMHYYSRSTCSSHGNFDDDNATILSTLSRILNKNMFEENFV